jgi:CPA2 family monovalent cation:H+ antiporter-2
MLLLQDLCIVPMMLVIPALGQSGDWSWKLVGFALLKAVVLLVSIVLAARALFPWLLRQVAFLKNRELFILFIVFACLTTAWLTSGAGLSLALGAFIAGLVISESEFSHQVLGDIEPLKDCFSGIFFISIGMLLKLDLLLADFLVPVQGLLLIVAVKFLVVVPILWWLYGSVRLGVLVGLSLAQIGEFSFVLAAAGRDNGLFPMMGEPSFLGASILSMMATPLLVHWAHSAAFGLDRRLRSSSKTRWAEQAREAAGEDTGHVIAVGYGLNGQNLTRVLKVVGIPYRILDLDPDLVRQAKAAGEPIHFGDGTRLEILRKMGIDAARILVVAISDSVATAHMVSLARSLRSDLTIIVRTRYVTEIDRLYQLGADQVIPEEFETSIEIFAHVLQHFHIPRNVISLQVDLTRKEHYGTLRGLRLQGRSLDQLSQYLAGTTTDIFLILENSPAAGKTFEELDLRSRTGTGVIAVVRDGVSIQNPSRDFRLTAGDILILLGSHKELDEAMRFLEPQQ